MAIIRSAFRVGVFVRLVVEYALSVDTPITFDFWVPYDLNLSRNVAPGSTYYTSSDSQYFPEANNAEVYGMTVQSVELIADGIVDPSLADAGLSPHETILGWHYRIHATYLAGSTEATWLLFIGSQFVANELTHNPWPVGKLDRAIAIFNLKVNGATPPLLTPGHAHARAIVNI